MSNLALEFRCPACETIWTSGLVAVAWTLGDPKKRVGCSYCHRITKEQNTKIFQRLIDGEEPFDE